MVTAEAGKVGYVRPAALERVGAAGREGTAFGGALLALHQAAVPWPRRPQQPFLFGYYRNRGQQHLRVAVARLTEHRLGRATLDDTAPVHDRDPGGHVARHAEVVGDEQIGEIELCLEVEQKPQHPRLDRHVERRGRLVQDDHVRLGRQRSREGSALALPSRERCRIAVHVFRRDADDAQKLGHRLRVLARRHHAVHP